MTDGQKILPPLPASDQKSISANRFDTYYQVRSRDFWSNNEIIRETPEAFKKCEHFFLQKGGSVQCQKCNFGLVGLFEVQDGKLFYKKEPLGL